MVDAADEVDVLRHLDSLVRKSLVVADHTATRTRYGLFETIRQFAEDRLAEAGELEQARDRHAAYFAREAAAAVGALERARVARRGRLGRGGAGQPARGIPVERWHDGEVEVATDIAAHAALMGFSVQLFETLAWAEELLERGRRPTCAGSPACTRPPATRASPGRAEAARANAHRATELEMDARYDACEPGYASFIEALGQRVLRRPRPLRGAHRRGGGAVRPRPGLRPRRHTSTACSRAVGSRRHWRSPRSPSRPRDRSATPTGSPTRSGSRGWRSRRRTRAARCGMGRGRRFRARAPRPLLRRLPRPRRGTPAHI